MMRARCGAKPFRALTNIAFASCLNFLSQTQHSHRFPDYILLRLGYSKDKKTRWKGPDFNHEKSLSGARRCIWTRSQKMHSYNGETAGGLTKGNTLKGIRVSLCFMIIWIHEFFLTERSIPPKIFQGTLLVEKICWLPKSRESSA